MCINCYKSTNALKHKDARNIRRRNLYAQNLQIWSLENLAPKWKHLNYQKNDKLPNGFSARNLIYKIKNKYDYERVKNGGFPLVDLSNYNCEI